MVLGFVAVEQCGACVRVDRLYVRNWKKRVKKKDVIYCY